jgi:hypothetical protein
MDKQHSYYYLQAIVTKSTPGAPNDIGGMFGNKSLSPNCSNNRRPKGCVLD